jgi:hypothetical protein
MQCRLPMETSFYRQLETVIETFDDRYLKPAASPINYESEQNRGKHSNWQSAIVNPRSFHPRGW